jgi:hypothetical protein
MQICYIIFAASIVAAPIPNKSIKIDTPLKVLALGTGLGVGLATAVYAPGVFSQLWGNGSKINNQMATRAKMNEVIAAGKAAKSQIV